MTSSVAALATAVAIAIAPFPALAQDDAHDAAQAPELDFGALLGEMGGGVSQFYGELLRSMAATLADPALSKDLARFTRNFYNELVAQGFTKEEALRIVIGTGIPLASGGS